MAETKHSPGPWRIVPYRGSQVHDRITSWLLHLDYDGDEISREDTWGEIYGAPECTDEMKANARLIAAAPELLAACQEFVRKVDAGVARSTRSYTQMKAAIKKATSDD